MTKPDLQELVEAWKRYKVYTDELYAEFSAYQSDRGEKTEPLEYTLEGFAEYLLEREGSK